MRNIDILRRHNPTTNRIIIKDILCEEYGIKTHIVPEYIEVLVDKKMKEIYHGF